MFFLNFLCLYAATLNITDYGLYHWKAHIISPLFLPLFLILWVLLHYSLMLFDEEHTNCISACFIVIIYWLMSGLCFVLVLIPAPLWI